MIYGHAGHMVSTKKNNNAHTKTTYYYIKLTQGACAQWKLISTVNSASEGCQTGQWNKLRNPSSSPVTRSVESGDLECTKHLALLFYKTLIYIYINEYRSWNELIHGVSTIIYAIVMKWTDPRCWYPIHPKTYKRTKDYTYSLRFIWNQENESTLSLIRRR